MHIPTSFQGIVNIFKSYGRLHQHLSLSRFSRPSADWWVSICLITSAHIGSRVQIFERVHWAADKFCQIANMSSRLWSIKVSIRESWHTFEPNQSILAACLWGDTVAIGCASFTCQVAIAKERKDLGKCHLSHQRRRQKRGDRYASIIQTNGISLPSVADKIHTYMGQPRDYVQCVVNACIAFRWKRQHT